LIFIVILFVLVLIYILSFDKFENFINHSLVEFEEVSICPLLLIQNLLNQVFLVYLRERLINGTPVGVLQSEHDPVPADVCLGQFHVGQILLPDAPQEFVGQKLARVRTFLPVPVGDHVAQFAPVYHVTVLGGL